ncbi:Fanconi anemia core complex-associated protein 24 isoform X2 [Paramisgurnus dabryanus]|uniref:Fanconi anemia core complex-associated protein 24 isoform X2 n=1 Tax=Paramisgurnus dabryanus TaxID=90735 RepID=UPI0031F41EA6
MAVCDSKPVPAKLLNAAPPYGHVIVNEKWRGSTLVQSLKESDLVAGSGHRRKIARFRNANSGLQGIVIVEKTHLSEQYFSGLQKFVVFELGLTLLPVSSPVEAAQLIGQLVLGENKENPFRRKSVSRLLEPVVLNLVQQIPGVGKVKAMLLLQTFPSIYELSGASVDELEPIVGQSTAQNITAFFHTQFT